ncbi:MAG: formate dehydrogenase subunit gamma [Gammaproteobacteria bacterium]|nr:formate dehydrogenase subunit gamma [Gammaproteobacteria bacterium]
MSNVESNQQGRLVRRKKAMAWSFVLMLLAVLVLPMSGYIYQGMSATAQADGATWKNENPRSNFWRSVREGSEGYTANKDVSGVLINSAGQNWRLLRNGPVATLGAIGLFVSLAAIAFFYFKHGQVKIDNGRAGQTVERWTKNERILHWTVASLFIILGITGLSLLYGKAVLIPLLGAEGFAWYADLAKILHNYLGPVFFIAIVILLSAWFKHNIIDKVDIEWFRHKAGVLGKPPHEHASAGRMNAGEKIWFWIIASAGILVCLSGLVMDFPNLGWSHFTMQSANILHSTLALIWVAVAFGHIYIGTAGSEGSLEAMTTGQVDVEWAKQHHDLWYEEVKNSASSSTENK